MGNLISSHHLEPTITSAPNNDGKRLIVSLIGWRTSALVFSL